MPTYYLLSCQHCKSEFNVLSRNRNRKFCSKSCAALYNNKQRSPQSRLAQKLSLQKTLKDTGRSRTDEKIIYKAKCQFKFCPYHYPNLIGYELLIKNGIYHYLDNPNGVVRDHILSIEEGWLLNISPDIISHPVNCQFMSNTENSRKGLSSWITLEQLKERILYWTTNKDLSSLTVNPNNYRYEKERPVFKYVIQNKISKETFQTTNITNWSLERGLTKSTVYNNHKEWEILEKYNLKTGKKLI